jgi:hypothetical protein
MKKPKKTIHERIEKLKKRAEKEGIKLVIEFGQEVNQNWSEPTFTATNPKDEWEGVEFAECVLKSLSYTVGLIYPIKYKTITCIETKMDDFNNENSQDKMFFKPSTESAYVEQLKAKAFELFGEIKEGDRFERTSISVLYAEVTMKKDPDGMFIFRYFQNSDTLFLGAYGIYSKGKWAKRCKERVKVKNWSYRTYEKYGQNYHECTLIVPVKEFSDDVHIFLTSKLEEYLNR